MIMSNISNSNTVLRIALLLIISLFSISAFAHDVVGELEDMSKGDKAILYLNLGYKHILPLGLDHILFVLSLFLFSADLKKVLWQSLAFTVAHSVTLGLAVYDVITISPNIVEPLIALSIMYVALENIFAKKLKASRIGIIFLFGLIHGLGFANAIRFMMEKNGSIGLNLLGFNLGLEAGQIVVVTCILILSFIIVNKAGLKRKWWVMGLSVLSILMATKMIWESLPSL